MLVIPTIDLYKGKVVRMVNGLREKTKIYEKDPVTVVKELVNNGFLLIHVVDLSRAIDNKDENSAILISLSPYSPFIQIGGGIRTIDYAKYLFEMGYKRQIVSSKVLEEPEFLLKMKEIGIEPIFSLDTKKENILYKGWLSEKPIDIFSVIEKLKKFGVSELIHTEVEKDGTLEEHDFTLTKRLVLEGSLQVLAAGGISSENSLRKAKEIYIETKGAFKGVIVGRAFLENILTIEVMKKYAC